HVLVNQTTGGSVGGDYVIFPIFFAEQAGKGEWLFSFDQREGGEVGADGEITNLSFYLAMSRLGDIHISLSTRPQSVSGVITLATAEAAEHVRQHLALLVQALERVTGAATVITCRSGPVDCLRALKDDLTSKVGVVGRYALIDVRT
ncbi:MAG: flagellar hook-length control protein FliK, partial [Desulfobulbaceae bacterium]|nr:flagellar hook-length control protein FliK [Desulfobulbaceae bacterium]